VLLLSGRRHPLHERDLAGVSLHLRGRVGHVRIEIVGADSFRTPCHGHQVRRIAGEETIISWPQSSWPQFPFHGKEAS